MQQATHITKQIAAGNLIIDTDNSVSNQSNNDLLFVLSIMRKGLSAIADNTHIGIKASLQAADRTRNQADSLQQTAASMEELTTTVQQNADNTREATELAEHSMGTAQQGGKEVQALIDSMQGIAQIDDVTQQNTDLVDDLGNTMELLATHAQTLDQAIRVLNTEKTPRRRQTPAEKQLSYSE